MVTYLAADDHCAASS